MDSAFSKQKFNFLIKLSQSLPVGDREEILVNRDATSMQQLAEWGMRMFQSSFPRIKDCIIYEEQGERRLILQMLILLFNYRANTVGINQILNVYMPELNVPGNVFDPRRR